MSTIALIEAHEVFDSRGNPTLEVLVESDSGARGRAIVPSGASTGLHEAHELRDGDSKRFSGKGVLKAQKNVIEKIAPKLLDIPVQEQNAIDRILIDLDGSPNKKNLGANAILGVSLAVAHCAADDLDLPLYRYIGGARPSTLPQLMMNFINGGAHADNGVDVQEFMIIPQMGDLAENLRLASEVFQCLKKILVARSLSTGVGDEGGFAPRLENNAAAVELILEAIEKAGFQAGDQVTLALDVAATELYKEGTYRWEGRSISGEELMDVYASWLKKYPLVSIEDPFAEDDWAIWKKATASLACRLVGDDLFVTNPLRILKGIEEAAANALLVKPNQIGTLTETMEAVRLAERNNFVTVMSHRSGESEDSTIAHLAVGLGCDRIKTGSICRGERTAKYNELLRIARGLA